MSSTIRPVHPLIERLFLVVLAVLPFYLPVATWVASNVGSIYVLSAWKELLILVLALVLWRPSYALLHHPDEILKWLNRLIVVYLLLGAVYVFWADSLFEFGAGWLFMVRFLVFFMVAQVLAQYFTNLPRKILRLVVIVAVILAGLAIVQAFLLPPTFLQHLGYEAIDQEIPGFPPAVTTLGTVSDLIRPQASLRGPNPLGAFFILPLCALVVRFFYKPKQRLKTGLVIGLIGGALILTFSRSAWIGSVIAVGIVLLTGIRYTFRTVHTRLLLITVIIGGLVCFAVLGSQSARLIFLHDDGQSGQHTSDVIRHTLATEAINDVASHPLGYGPGNAGPVSVLEGSGSGKIAENYFLQVAQEVGWVGLGLLLAVHALLLSKLYALRQNRLALIALASFVGLIVTNLFLHTWADDVVAILWWSYAGAIMGSMVSLKNRQPKHG